MPEHDAYSHSPFDPDSLAQNFPDSSTTPGSDPFKLEWSDASYALQLPEVEWLVPGMLAARSLALLTGTTKAGKSLLLLGLLKASQGGTNFLGYSIPRLRSWMLTEASDYALAAQMRMMNMTPAEDALPVCYYAAQEIIRMTPQAFTDALLRDYEVAYHKDEAPHLIAIDTLGRWLRLGDWNDYATVTAATAPLLTAAKEMRNGGTSVILVHHARKSGGEGAEASLGSQAIAGAVDSVLTLKLRNGGEAERRTLRIQSRFGLNDKLGDSVDLELTLPTGEYRQVDASNDLNPDILAAIGRGADTVKAITKMLKEQFDESPSQATVSRRLTSLVDSGVLQASGNTKSRRFIHTPRENNE